MGLASIARKTHWVGVFLLFVASMLMLFVTLSAPIINRLGLLRVDVDQGSVLNPTSIRFGTYGYCILNTGPNFDDDDCSKRHMGYSTARVMAGVQGTQFSDISGGTAASLTRVMVLHPIICGLAFIAFLLSLGGHIIGSLAGALVALLAFVLTLIVLATDFTTFGIVRNHVNDDPGNSRAYFSSAIWLVLVTFVLLFFGMVIVLFTCASTRREKKREKAAQKNEGAPAEAGTAAPKKKKFGLF